jgi:hypothetical protein
MQTLSLTEGKPAVIHILQQFDAARFEQRS